MNNINIMSGPRRVEIKVVNQETKIQTSLVGLLVLSFAGLVSLLLSGEIFVKRVNGPTFFNLVLIFSSPQAV